MRRRVGSGSGAIKLGLLADGVPINAASLSKVVVELTDGDGNVTTYDSNNNANAFDWTTETALVSDTETGILVIRLQDAVSPSPPTAANDYMMNIIVYDSLNTDGINWDVAFPVQVI